MPRQTKLTPQTISAAVDLFKRGYQQQEMYRALGVGETTWFTWLKKGREGKHPYKELVDALEQAAVERRIYLRGIIENAAQKNWVCAAWLLEREWPQLYAKPEARWKHAQEEDVVVEP